MSLSRSWGRGAVAPLFKNRDAVVWLDQKVVLVRQKPRQRRLMAVGVAAGLCAWGAVSTAAWWSAQSRLDDQSGEMRNMELGYAQLIAGVGERRAAEPATPSAASGPAVDSLVARNDALNRRVAELQGALDEAQAALIRTSTAERTLQAEIDRLTGELAGTQGERSALGQRVAMMTDDLTALATAQESLANERASLRALATQLQQELARANDRNVAMERRVDDLALTVQGTFAMVDRLDQDRQSLTTRLAMNEPTLRDALAGAEQALRDSRSDVRDLQVALDTARAQAVSLQMANEALQEEKAGMIGQVTRLQSELDGNNVMTEQMFATLRERSEEHVAEVEGGLALTGLDIGNLVDRLRSDAGIGAGGPMVPTLPDGLIAEAAAPAAVPEAADLGDLVEHATDLRLVASKLPLSVPLDAAFRLTSGFGVRHDPFTGRSSRHEGLDFAAPLRTTVHVTAPGVVSFAGRRGAYGNMVEVNHGLGISTRYAHLHAITVEVGQELGLGDEVGLLGSTGRSTGPHVHYEVLVDGEPWDPMNFLEAGRRVQEIARQMPASG